jgi:DnaJ-class molecular chaperone
MIIDYACCPQCHGTGYCDGPEDICQLCKGRGQIPVHDGGPESDAEHDP